tara:strand:- start:575 stop:781 length:207 start_codon:yes stop_codon:yes gene_type:complete
MESTYWSDDDLREASVIKDDGYSVLCTQYSAPPKTTKQYFERVATTSSKQFKYLSEAEDYAEDWVLRK